ncbi:cysteine proteinase inhibitor 12 [Magnolia sinica]|uniref:cysteine proteinase inhibitor 12 n=1 Tax=Magnolia sinica TaxID=86752 RepID=UPI0026585C8E|nr:cysteine proteinase inhibitor 12 [Magnolia sinica]
MRRIALFYLLVCLFSCDSGISRDWIKMATALGGISDCSSDHQNSLEIEGLARFAVEEHNKKENALLEFVRVVKAKEQTVAGKLHHLTLEAIDAGKKKLYEAKVWVKAWENFKELQEFKHTGDSAFTRSDLGAKRGDHEPGWKTVSADDPVVQDAANHAVKTIQQRSNSLAPYELLEVVDAKAEVIEDSAKFDMLLKLKRGSKEEKLKVEVHKNIEGTFHLNQMQPHEHAD